MRIVIIGSGPTALGAATRLHQLMEDEIIKEKIEVVILEKESEVGGLARSITDKRGFTWDLGVHITGGSKYLKFTHMMNKTIKEWNNVPRRVKAYMGHIINEPKQEDNYVPYPVQDSIPYFPDHVKIRSLNEMKELSAIKEKNCENFADFTRETFGQTLQDIFIRPYNEKVWTVKLEEMNTDWASSRVPHVDGIKLETRCQLSKDELKREESQKSASHFKYPTNLRGGGLIWQKVASNLPDEWIKLNEKVESINSSRRIIQTSNNNSYKYDYIISTMSIVELGKLSELAPEIQLKHSKVILVGIGIRKPQTEFTEDLSWLYFPQPDIIFYRCTFISNFNERMTPNAALFWSVICEIGLKPDEEAKWDDILKDTVKDLYTVGILDEESEVMHNWVFELPLGYPIPTKSRNSELKRAHAVLETNRIYSRGRFGGWKYEVANQDHSFMMGIEVVDRILFSSDETVYSV